MIVGMHLDEDNKVYATTAGCGCCSETLYKKKEIVDQLKRNMSLLKQACDMLGISITDLEEQ